MMSMSILNDCVLSMSPILIDDVEYNTKFDFGSLENLQETITSSKGKPLYPFIYCFNDYSFKSNNNGTYGGILTFVIATNNSDVNMSNIERLNVTFENVIKPTLIEFLNKIDSNKNVFKIGDIFNFKNYYGYDVLINKSSELGVSEFWDCFKFDINLNFKNCTL